MKTQRITFNLGNMTITPNALDSLHPEDVFSALQRHAAGDWGECCPEDWEANEQALREGERLFSVYRDRDGNMFWIITESNLSATTVLLPKDY